MTEFSPSEPLTKLHTEERLHSAVQKDIMTPVAVRRVENTVSYVNPDIPVVNEIATGGENGYNLIR